MKKLKTLKDIPDLNGKRVLLRLDLNVPMQNGKIRDTTRIDRAKPTLDYLKQRGASVLILTHLGRPIGKVNPELSLQPIANYLNIPLVRGFNIPSMNPGEIVLLENIRFYPGEEINDIRLAKDLAQTADVYVNDAFSVSHRAHMSIDAISRFLPSYAGLLMEEEISALKRALEVPQFPLVAIVGGAKISTKLKVLENLAEKVDTLIIGGAMANTFLLAQGYSIGRSLVEANLCSDALHLLERSPCKIILPTDVVVADQISEHAKRSMQSVAHVQSDQLILDVGSETTKYICDALQSSKTVIVNGPLGVFEVPPFDASTNHVLQKIASLTKEQKLISVAGGGDTVAALKHAGVELSLTYVSTAGGAFLEWLEGRTLPGIEALQA